MATIQETQLSSNIIIIIKDYNIVKYCNRSDDKYEGVAIFIYNNYRYLFLSRTVNNLEIVVIKILQFNINVISAYCSDQILVQSDLEINSFSDPYLIGTDLNAKHSEQFLF